MYFNVRSKADIISLIYRTEPTTKKVENRQTKRLKTYVLRSVYARR